MSTPSTTDVAFSPAVKGVQERLGSRSGYARLEAKGGWPARVTAELAAFIAGRTSFYLATASAAGQPYIQHRGGPKGFLKLLDGRTLAFADFAGNRQYITLGNLSENPRAMLFLMDYGNRRRLKIWGRAEVVEDDPGLLSRLSDAGYDGRVERAIVFAIEAWDLNCPQHIPVLLDPADVTAAVAALRRRIARLEAALVEAGVPLPAISRETDRGP